MYRHWNLGAMGMPTPAQCFSPGKSPEWKRAYGLPKRLFSVCRGKPQLYLARTSRPPTLGFFTAVEESVHVPRASGRTCIETANATSGLNRFTGRARRFTILLVRVPASSRIMFHSNDYLAV